MTDQEKRIEEIKAERERERILAQALSANREALKKNIGKCFTNGKREGTVLHFCEDKVLGVKTGDAYLVNFGNPNRSDFIFCDDFLTTFKGKE